MRLSKAYLLQAGTAALRCPHDRSCGRITKAAGPARA